VVLPIDYGTEKRSVANQLN